MDSTFKKSSYLIINNEEEDNFNAYIKKNRKKSKRITTRVKLINKYLINNMTLFKCFCFFLIIIIAFSLLLQIFGNLHLNYINNIISVQNIINSKKSENNFTTINETHKTEDREKKIKINDNNNTIIKNKNDSFLSNDTTKNITKNITKNETETKNETKNKKYIPTKEAIYKKYSFPSLRQSFQNSKDFLDKAIKGILINDKNKFHSSENPEISSIIPVYNSQKMITRAVRSIQNQNILNLEIILVNDCSKDNSLSVIENLQKEDPRIKIIKNKKNMGILYSRSIGTLSAKGKYIFALDNDDMFLYYDTFKTISDIAKEGDFDIVEFRGVLVKGDNNLLKKNIEKTWNCNHKPNTVLFQPEMGDYPLQTGKKIGDIKIISCYLWCKCIKTEIYQKGLNILGKDRYSRYMTAHEDVVMMFILFNIGKSYKFVEIYGLFRVFRTNSGYHSTKELQQNIKNIYFADIVIDFAKNTNEHKKLILYIMYNVLKLKLLETIIKLDKIYKDLVFSCLDRFFNLSFISTEYKIQIMDKVKSIKYLNYNVSNTNIN